MIAKCFEKQPHWPASKVKISFPIPSRTALHLQWSAGMEKVKTNASKKIAWHSLFLSFCLCILPNLLE